MGMHEERVTVEKKDGDTLGPFKAVVSRRKITMFSNGSADVIEGDVVVRPLPAGREERFEITESSFFPAGSRSHYSFKVRKETDPPPAGQGPAINIGTATGVQIGDYNTQTVVGAIQALVQQIEDSDATQDEKDEAKSRLRAFLEDPLVRTVLGAAISGVIASL